MQKPLESQQLINLSDSYKQSSPASQSLGPCCSTRHSAVLHWYHGRTANTHFPPLSGWLLASNSDPVQQQLFTASRSHKALHSQLTSDTAFRPDSPCSLRAASAVCIWPLLAVLDTSKVRAGRKGAVRCVCSATEAATLLSVGWLCTLLPLWWTAYHRRPEG